MSVKQVMPILAISGLTIFALILTFIVSSRPVHPEKYLECDPAEVTDLLDRIFGIDLPNKIQDFKTAKTHRTVWRGWTDFILKFSAEPNVIDTFIESFPEDIKLKAYEHGQDLRGGAREKSYIPSWFLKQIKEGVFSPEGLRGSKNSILWIYIDKSDKNNFVVYMEGIYNRKLEK